jgi:cadmium resistance protein CadD (predicted permease)
MRKELWLPALLHFFVDFFSVYALYAFHLSGELAAILILAYDALAFLPQPLFGAIFEKSHHLAYLGSFGCLLVIIGALIPEAITALIFFGIGNALFHVCEGKLVLDKAEKSAPLGVFISFGSIGLGLALCFSNIYLFLSLLLVFIILAILNCFVPYGKAIAFVYEAKKGQDSTMLSALILIVLGVFLRGFFGQYTQYALPKNDFTYLNALWFALAVFFGKAIGGFLLDYFGSLPLILLSALLSFVGYFFPSSWALSLMGVVGVNLLMALTMEFMRRAMPKFTAFGFGLLAAFLLLGFESGFALKNYAAFQVWLDPVLILLNAASLVLVYFLLRKEGRQMTALLAFKPQEGKA